MKQTKNSDYYNPEENTTDEKLPKTVEKVISNSDENEVETQKLAKLIDENGLFSEDTVLSKLYYAIPDIRERSKTKVEKRKGGNPGDFTWTWKVIDG